MVITPVSSAWLRASIVRVSPATPRGTPVASSAASIRIPVTRGLSARLLKPTKGGDSVIVVCAPAIVATVIGRAVAGWTMRASRLLETSLISIKISPSATDGTTSKSSNNPIPLSSN